MAKKDKNSAPERETYKASDYYNLKTKAVKDLVEANESNSPQVSEKEIRKYKSGVKFRIPDMVKIVFIKWWFAASICFFFLWGLGTYMSSMLDLIFITGIVLGMVTDILTNNALRFFEPEPGAWSKWLMFYKKRYATFPLNILYSFVLMFFVYSFYRIVNVLAIQIQGLDESTIVLAVEPILFGLLYMGFDMLALVMRNTFRNIVADARKPGR